MQYGLGIHGLTLKMVYSREFIPAHTNYLTNFIQTYKIEIAEYALEIDDDEKEKVFIVDNGRWNPKRILSLFSDHLVEIMKTSVSVKCIYTIGMYQKKITSSGSF